MGGLYGKTLLKYVVKFLIVSLILTPLSILTGFFNQIHPFLSGTGELIAVYLILGMHTYRKRANSREEELYYIDRIVGERFYLGAEIGKVLSYHREKLITDFLAMLTLMVLFIGGGSKFGFYNETVVMTVVVKLIILFSFPIIDVFLFVFARKKWFRDHWDMINGV